jgi:DNA-binding NtrC family response regulator
VKEKLETLVTEMIDKRIFFDEAVAEFEKRFIQTALARNRGNKTKAAETLGLHRNTLSRKIAQYSLNGRR